MVQIHQEKLSEINKNLVILKRFEGGMSNYTYLCQHKDNTDDLYVFRYPGEGSEVFVDFESEMYNLNAINKLDITSEVIYIDTKGIKLAKFIKGKTLNDNIDYLKTSKLLNKLHTSNVKFKYNYDHLNRLEKYENIRSTKLTDEYIALKEQFLEIYNNELKIHISYPCHCDAQVSNIIMENNTNKLYLIDFEFAANNDYIYDIASFGNKNFDDAVELLQVYISDVKDEHYKRLYAWRMFQALQWHNVATYKNEIGLSEKFGLDFSLIACNYLALATKMLKKHNKF